MSAEDIPRNTYRVLKQLGSGGFGKVFKCITLDTGEIVAVKVIPKKFGWYAENELKALTQLRKHGRHENIVSLNRHFITKENYILEFEKLDMTLDDLIIETGRPLYLNEIQEVTQQIVMALITLSRIRMVHLDIKPDNIMLVNHKRWPFKVKLIDFGLAFSVDRLTTGYRIQTLDYRAPEVILGLPLTEAVDIWSLGCIVAFMFFGKDFYSARCEFDRIREMVRLQGQPEDKLLNSGIYSKNFFFHNVQSVSWELLEQCNCHGNGPSTTHNIPPSFMLKDLDEIVKDRPNTTGNEDMPAFLNLFKQMMEVDPEKRITTENALWHNFFKRKHFPQNCDLTQQGRFHGETCITTNEESRVEEPAVKSKLKSPIHMKEAANTNFDASHPVQEETAACASKECTLTKPPVKRKSKVKDAVRSERASSTKVADALSDCKKTAAYIKPLSSLKKATAKSKHMGKSRIHVKEATNTNVDASHPVQGETAACASKECTLTKPPVKRKSKVKDAVRSERASSTKVADALSDRKKTAAYIKPLSSLKKAPAKSKHMGKSRIHVKEATNTNVDASHPVQGETAVSASKECTLTKPPVKRKSKVKVAVRCERASSTKVADALSDHKKTAAYIKPLSSLKKAPEKPKRNGKSRIHMKKATNTNLDASHPVQEETTTCTSKEFRVKKPPVKPKNKAKSTTRIEVASSTKFKDSVSDHKETTASINAEGNLKKAPEKPQRNGKSRIHMKEAANTNLDASHPVQEETAICTSKECRLMKPPGKLKTKAKSTARTLKKPPVKPKNKSTTRIEVASSTKSEDSLSDHKVTTDSVNAEGNLQKAPEKPKSNGKSRIQMKDTSNTKFNKSLADHKDTAAFIKDVSSLKKTPMQPKHKEESIIRMKEASEIEFDECREKKPQKKPKRKASWKGVFMKIQRFFQSRFTCFKS